VDIAIILSLIRIPLPAFLSVSRRQKNASPSCLKRLLLGPRSDTRIKTKPSPATGAERESDSTSSASQERFTAPLPAGVMPEKYDETCDVSLALAKYGAGLPWYRLARLQESFGVTLPESIQFERCEAVADAALPFCACGIKRTQKIDILLVRL